MVGGQLVVVDVVVVGCVVVVVVVVVVGCVVVVVVVDVVVVVKMAVDGLAVLFFINITHLFLGYLESKVGS